MSTFFKIFLTWIIFFLTSESVLAHKCDSKISNRPTSCSTHLSNTISNKTIATTSLKQSKNKLLEKHKNIMDETDRNYFVCPACHM